MKTRTLASILILILVVLIIAGSCATTKKAISEEDAVKQFVGVYVNTEYSGKEGFYPQKFVIASDGRIERWISANSEYPAIRGEYTIAKSWTDLKGNLYCTVDVKHYGYSNSQDLWKLDKSGKTLEVNYLVGHEGEYPTKIDPNAEPWGPLYYNIFYRQE